ncbi:hypothetical protein STEG23_002148 [Scotinomys teguina]
MTVMPLGRDQGCSLKIREPDVPAPWFLDAGGWSKTAAVSLYFIFPEICTLSLGNQRRSFENMTSQPSQQDRNGSALISNVIQLLSTS